MSKVDSYTKYFLPDDNDSPEVVRLKGMVKSEADVVIDVFYELGVAYYEKYAGNTDTEFSAIVERIDSSIGKIDMLCEQIRLIKGIVKCNNCGADMKQSSSFCTKCGAKAKNEAVVVVAKEDTPAVSAPVLPVVCSNCGASLKAEAAFCKYCGAKVVDNKESSVDTAVVTEEPEVVATPVEAVEQEIVVEEVIPPTVVEDAVPAPLEEVVVDETIEQPQLDVQPYTPEVVPYEPQAPVYIPNATPYIPQGAVPEVQAEPYIPQAQPYTPQPQPEVDENIPTVKICPSCQHKLSADMNFCVYCGTKLN